MVNCFSGGPVLPRERVRRLNSTQLAYAGDTVYDLYVRSQLLACSDAQVRQLHSMAAAQVRASSQAQALERVLPMLSGEEEDIVRRGRNAKARSMPKNADPADYHRATALEALVGFLYLNGDLDRLDEIMRVIMMEVIT